MTSFDLPGMWEPSDLSGGWADSANEEEVCEQEIYGGAEICQRTRPCPVHDPKPFEEP